MDFENPNEGFSVSQMLGRCMRSREVNSGFSQWPPGVADRSRSRSGLLVVRPFLPFGHVLCLFFT